MLRGKHHRWDIQGANALDLHGSPGEVDEEAGAIFAEGDVYATEVWLTDAEVGEVGNCGYGCS